MNAAMYAVIGIWKAINVKILINRTDINDDIWIFLRELPCHDYTTSYFTLFDCN